MEKYPVHIPLYLKLFSLVYAPIPENFDAYLEFVEDQTLQIIKEEKYVVMGDSKIVSMQQIVRECSSIFSNIISSQGSIYGLKTLKNIFLAYGLEELVAKIESERGTLKDLDVLKVSALISKIDPALLISIYKE